jgi:putative colanic acid biosynthesis UDP-glucose lipid carrier transferase
MLPICVVIAIAIKLDSRGPVFFVQSRKGYSGRPFRILKFRSMSVMEDSGDIRQATRNDPRVTRIGAFIRSTSIDELPQFWNVLRGEMSVVGPRPHAWRMTISTER